VSTASPNPAPTSSPPDTPGSRYGRWFILASTVFWGSSATLARYMFRDHHVSPFVVVELRLGLSAIAMGIWLAVWRRDLLRIRREDIPYLLILGVVGLAGVQGTYYFTISRLGVGLAILIQYLAPTLIVLLDLVRGQKVEGRTLVACAAALGGTALLVGGIDRNALTVGPIPWLTGFGSAILYAFYILYSKRGLERYSPITMLFYSLCVASALWAIVTPPWRIVAANYPREVWICFVLLAIFSTLVPFLLFYAGLRGLRPTQTGILATFEPVVAVMTAAIFLGEGLGPLQSLGAVFVLIASVLASSRETS